MNLFNEFKPALLFLGKFLAFYFAGNILYGLLVESYGNKPDIITGTSTRHSAWLLGRFGYEVKMEDHPVAPKISMKEEERIVLNVFEGCNGINVMIVFVAFLFAFGGPVKTLAIFLPAGLLIIHAFNLFRIAFLYHLALNNSRQFYYYHKYFFTATLYLVVFVLWAIWAIRSNEKRNIKTGT